MSETPVEAAPQAVIDHLTRQIAALSLDNAVLRAALDAATTPQPDEGARTVTEAIWVALITQSGVIGAAVVGMWRKLGRIDQQTTNSHTGSPYPNLRDEITAVRSTVEATAQTVLSHGRHLERIDRNILDLHAVTDATDTALDRTRTTTLRAQAREAAERENALRELEHRLRADIRAALAEAWQNSPAMKGPTP